MDQALSIHGEDGQATPWTERFVQANGITLHIAEAGPADAPLVVLLHGFPDYFASWRRQLVGLADQYHVVAPDMRGYNLSDKPTSGYDVATLAADVRELIHALGHEDAVVVGHDWGGAVAWVVGIREPEVVRKLVVLNAPHPAAALREMRNPRQIRRSSYIAFFQLRGVAERVITRDDYALIRRTLRSSDPEHTWISDAEIEESVAAISRPGALSAALEYYRQLPRDLPHVSPLRIIAAPTLLLWGERDPYLGPEMTTGLAPWIHDLRVLRFPTLGHWPHRQDPERINAALRAFIG